MLWDQHWLPIDLYVQFKALFMTYKALNGPGSCLHERPFHTVTGAVNRDASRWIPIRERVDYRWGILCEGPETLEPAFYLDLKSPKFVTFWSCFKRFFLKRRGEVRRGILKRTEGMLPGMKEGWKGAVAEASA